jgi:hypothetical protein
MEISVVCQENKCDSIVFTVKNVFENKKNYVFLHCFKCNTIRAKIRIDNYKQAVSKCPHCSNNTYISKQEDKGSETLFTLLCSECKKLIEFINIDEDGNEISEQELKVIKLSERIKILNERMAEIEDTLERLRTRVDYSIENKLDSFDYRLDSVVSNIYSLEEELRKSNTSFNSQINELKHK